MPELLWKELARSTLNNRTSKHAADTLKQNDPIPAERVSTGNQPQNPVSGLQDQYRTEASIPSDQQQTHSSKIVASEEQDYDCCPLA